MGVAAKGRVIAVINQKGGVGKTTSVVNIGAGLTRLGHSVLVVDLDAQAHLTYSLGIVAQDLRYTIYDCLKGTTQLRDVVLEKEGLAIVPAAINLTDAEAESPKENDREGLLKNALSEARAYDFILLDRPPNLGLVTQNALAAASEVFVPMQAEFLSIKGLNQILDMVEKVKQKSNQDLTVSGIILTQYDGRLKLHNEVLEGLQKHFADKLFDTIIRRNVALAESTSFGQSIFAYAPKSIGAQDYGSLCNEIVSRR